MLAPPERAERQILDAAGGRQAIELEYSLVQRCCSDKRNVAQRLETDSQGLDVVAGRDVAPSQARESDARVCQCWRRVGSDRGAQSDRANLHGAPGSAKYISASGMLLAP